MTILYGLISIAIEFYNSSNKLLSKKTTAFSLSTSEQNYNWEFSTPSTFDYAILKFYEYGDPDKDVYIKDVSLIGGALWQRVTQLQMSVDGMETEVSNKIGNDELSTKLRQDYESVQIAWNKISEFIQFINAQLQIKDENKKLLMALDKEGEKFYRNDVYVGSIGTNSLYSNNTQRGLSFNLGLNGYYMTWAAKMNENDPYTLMKLSYVRPGTTGFKTDGLCLGTDLKLNGYSILGEKLELCEVDYANDNGNYYGLSISDDISDIALFTRDESWFNSDLYIKGNKVLTNTSDGRLKKEIYATIIDALDIISQIKHRQFTWKKDNIHENIGYIAQELEEIDPNYVHKNAQYDEEGNIIDYTYQVNLLPILATATKAIQELNTKVNEQQQTIEKQQEFIKLIAEKFNMQDEYNNMFNTTVKRKSRARKEQEVVFDEEIQYTRRKKQNRKHKVIKQYKDGQVEIIEESEEAK